MTNSSNSAPTGGSPPGAPAEPFVASTLAASLTIGDLRRSLAWYRDVLGFAVARTFDRDGTPFAASLRAGAVAIRLTQDDGARGADRVEREGMSLRLTTTHRVDEIARRIRERGGTLDSEPADAWGHARSGCATRTASGS